MFRGKDVQEIKELKREGVSIGGIKELTGCDPKTIRKYLKLPAGRPEYRARPAKASKLEPFKPYLNDRLQAGVWNAQVLLHELRKRDYGGGYSILTDWLRPRREAAGVAAVRRFETPHGQASPGRLGSSGFAHRWRRTAADLGLHDHAWLQPPPHGRSRNRHKARYSVEDARAAFQQWGCVPEEILYDRMKTVWAGTDERGEIVWNSMFLDFARYWDFTGVKYVRRNFLCGLQGREPSNLADLNGGLRSWVAEVANQRVHGTTHEKVMDRWARDQAAMQPVGERAPYPCMDDEQRKVARDAYVSWQGSRYSVPWKYAGQEVWVRDRGSKSLRAYSRPVNLRRFDRIRWRTSASEVWAIPEHLVAIPHIRILTPEQEAVRRHADRRLLEAGRLGAVKY